MDPMTRRLLIACAYGGAVAYPLQAQEFHQGNRFAFPWPAVVENQSLVLERSSDLQTWTAVRVVSGRHDHPALVSDVSSKGRQGYYRARAVDASTDTDGDGIPDLSELAEWPAQHPLNPGTPIATDDGALALASSAHFQELAYQDLTQPELELREVKFLVAGLNEDSPQIWFMNTARHRSHSLFANQVLGIRDFLQFGYAGSVPRKYFAGTLVYRPNTMRDDGSRGIYLIESLPNDPIDLPFIARIYDLVSLGAPDLEAPIAYHPSGDVQRALWSEARQAFDHSFVTVVTDETLYASQPYQALNGGVSYGWLRLASGAAIDSLRPSDIAIFQAIPNEIGRLAGVITETPQTPLSHVNLRARQDGVPNAYVRNASLDPAIAPFIDQPVRFEVTAAGLTLSKSSATEVEHWLDAIRPQDETVLEADLTTQDLRSLATLGHTDFMAYGSKASNLGELGKIIPEHSVSDGFAVPYSWFEEAMADSGLDQWIAAQLPRLEAVNRETRNALLKAIRKRIRDVAVSTERIALLEAQRATFPADQPLRCRSSANSEDLLGFNGAGLYESYTHRPHEGLLVNSIRQVWASLWTERAFEERAFYRIDHLTAKMAVLVHPNFDDELANGVAVATNLFTAGAPGYTINAQLGEDLVTNPSASAVPEEWIVVGSGPSPTHWHPVRMRASSLNRPGKDENVLSVDETTSVASLLETITSHFKEVTGAVSPRFAMEIEFKITAQGALVIKQARPWVR